MFGNGKLPSEDLEKQSQELQLFFPAIFGKGFQDPERERERETEREEEREGEKEERVRWTD